MSSPNEFLLCSFNALTLEKPSDIFNKAVVCTPEPVSSEYVSSKTTFQSFTGRYEASYSAQSMQTTFNAEFGVEAEYAEVAGSAQLDYTQQEYTSSTAFNAAYYCVVNCGTTSLNVASINDQGKDIKSLLDTSLVTSLESIASLADAKTFTDTWGTHLITGVYLGGSLFIAIQANTETVEEYNSVSGTVGAQYKSASTSIAATASAAYQVATSSTTAKVSQRISTYGGSAAAALKIDPHDPSSFADWGATCSADTVQALNTSITFTSLLAQGSSARTILERYLQLSLLAKSLNHPTAFHYQVGLVKGQTSARVQITRPGYKILSGGAELTPSSNSFLTGTYPETQQGGISAWVAVSHDSKYAATGYLTAHAIAVYDPHNLLTVNATSDHKDVGYEQHTVTAEAAAKGIMVGGGCLTVAYGTSPTRFILGTTPRNDTAWVSVVRDYINSAASTTTWSFAVGIEAPPNLTVISHTLSQTGNLTNKGDTSCDVRPHAVVGGGAATNADENNFLTATYPKNISTWRETNSDGTGRDKQSVSSVFALYLDAQVTV